MNTRNTTILVLLAVLAMEATAHAPLASEPDLPVTAASLERWAQALDEFQREGRGGDLRLAQRFARSAAGADHARPDVRLLLARTAQADHDFDQARSHLSVLLRRQPGHEGARLMFAQLELLRGERSQALEHCSALRRIPVLVQVACRMQSRGTGDFRRLAALADSGLSGGDGALLGWVYGVVADLALQAGEEAAAERYYAHADTLSPAIRYRLAMVALLMRQSRNAEALAIVDAHADDLGMRVKAAILAQRVGRPDAALTAQLRAGFEHDLAHDDLSHGREMAEFFLEVDDDPERALALVLRYRAQQFEWEDATLLAAASARIDAG